LNASEYFIADPKRPRVDQISLPDFPSGEAATTLRLGANDTGGNGATINASGAKLPDMQPLKAHLDNGQVVLDEPTDLPNGTELYVVLAEQLGDVVLLRDDGLDDDERKRLHESIRRGIEDGRAGRVTDFDEFLDELDAQP